MNSVRLITIVGPTASGKSDLAMRIAKDFNGEIICADSRTIYKDMNIGTAKPSIQDQKQIPHWGLDLVKPGETFSAGKFKQYADTKILDIQNRGKLPILVGGTGLYVDGILFDFSFIDKKLALRRLFYSWQSIDKLQKTIQQKGWPMPKNMLNRRHLVRTIERAGEVGSRKNELSAGVLLVGLMPPGKLLKKHISSRTEAMFKRGIVKETQALLDKYGRKAINSTGGIAYKTVLRLTRGEISQEQAIELIKTQEWQYARRQKSWFKRNKNIKWFITPDEVYSFLTKTL